MKKNKIQQIELAETTYTRWFKRTFRTHPGLALQTSAATLPFRGSEGTQPGDRTAFGILLGTRFRWEIFDDRVVFCWFVGGGGGKSWNFGSMSVFFVFLKKHHLISWFFFSWGHKGEVHHVAMSHTVLSSASLISSAFGVRKSPAGTEHCLSCSGSNCRESQVTTRPYPRAKKVNTNVANLCHGCHGIPVSHKSHNRDDHESYCGLSQSITKRVYQMLQQICPISSNALLRFEFGTIVHKGNHAWWRRSWTPGSQSGNCTETWSPCRARSTVGQFVVYVSPGTTPFCWPPQMTRPSSCLGTQCKEFGRRLFALNTFANCKNCRILMKDMSKNMSKIICEYVKTRRTS